MWADLRTVGVREDLIWDRHRGAVGNRNEQAGVRGQAGDVGQCLNGKICHETRYTGAIVSRCEREIQIGADAGLGLGYYSMFHFRQADGR